MTALTLRVWATGAASWARDRWLLPCAAAAAVTGYAIIVLVVAYVTVTPMGEAALVALLPLCAAGSAATAGMLPARRPVRESRAARPRRCAAPIRRAGGTAPHPDPLGARGDPARSGSGWGAHSRPAAATSPRSAAAGLIYRTGRATVRGAA